jgi:hypothetical protein
MISFSIGSSMHNQLTLFSCPACDGLCGANLSGESRSSWIKRLVHVALNRAGRTQSQEHESLIRTHWISFRSSWFTLNRLPVLLHGMICVQAGHSTQEPSAPSCTLCHPAMNSSLLNFLLGWTSFVGVDATNQDDELPTLNSPIEEGTPAPEDSFKEEKPLVNLLSRMDLLSMIK